MPKTNGTNQPFEGFGSPNYTQVPDEVFDRLMPELSDAELRALMYIIRRTFGFKRESDNISLSQLVSGITTTDGRVLDRGAGLSKSAAAKAVKSLAEKGIIVSIRNRSTERGDEPTTYSLRFRDTPVSTKKTGGGLPNGHPRVHVVDTQYTGIQETEKYSNIRKAHAKKSDGTDGTGEQPTVSDPSVSAQSVSHSTPTPFELEAPETPPTTAAVAPAAAADAPETHHEPLSARMRGLGDSVPSETGVQEPPKTPGKGFERLREQAAKIRAEVRKKQEAEQQENERVTYATFGVTSSSMTPLAAVLPAKRGRPPGSREDRDHVAAYLKDFQHELGDEAPLPSSITRALNIFYSANMPPELWADCLYQARSITKERSAQISKKPSDKSTGYAAKNRAPYYFAVLEDLCGLREQPDPLASGTP